VYETITLASSKQVCGTKDFGTYNTFGNRRFLVLNLGSSRSVQISAQGPVGGTPTSNPPAADPDIALWRRGILIGTAQEEGTTETFTTPVLTPGLYIIEVADFSHIDEADRSSRRGDTCINVSVSG
jgi:hypothetical protein